MTATGKTIYRGWWVLGGLFVLYAASNGILVHSLPLLYPPLIAEFGWDEAQVTLPATMFYVVSAITSPPAGALMDRYSVRRIIAIGAIGIIGIIGVMLLESAAGVTPSASLGRQR